MKVVALDVKQMEIGMGIKVEKRRGKVRRGSSFLL